MALYGNDIDETTTMLEADLGWIVKLDKGPFVGSEVLARQAAEGVRRKLVGFEMRSRAIARHGYPVLALGREVGRVTSGSRAPSLDKNIGLAYLPLELSRPGTGFAVGIRGREEPAVVVKTPFYRRPAKAS
jgi:aminomethyltransferase